MNVSAKLPNVQTECICRLTTYFICVSKLDAAKASLPFSCPCSGNTKNSVKAALINIFISSDFMCCDSLEGDVGEQRGSREDGGDAAADVGDEGQDLVVLGVYMGYSSRYVLETQRERDKIISDSRSPAKHFTKVQQKRQTEHTRCSTMKTILYWTWPIMFIW